MRIAAIFGTMLLTLAGCGSGGAGWRNAAPGADAQATRGARGGQGGEQAARLAGATFGRVPGPSVPCVEVAALRGSRGLGDGLLLFDGEGGRQWVTRLSACPALSYGRTVRLAAPVAQLCRGGRIEVLEQGRPVATCAVGDFLSYAPR